VIITAYAEKQLRKMARKDVERLLNAVEKYEETGQGDVKKSQGREGGRLRVGTMRALFTIENDVIVFKAGYRKDIYERWEPMITINHEVLKDGRVAMSSDDFEDLMDALMFDEAKSNAGEYYPADFAKKLLLSDENRIRLFREYRGLTQKQLADSVGISQNAISDIEKGKKEGSTKTLKGIALALDISLDDLI